MEKSERCGFLFLGLALAAFLGLGLEMIPAYLIEPVIYGGQAADWNTAEILIHWSVTCVIWGIFTASLCAFAAKKSGESVFKQKKPLRIGNWAVCLALTAACVIISLIDWKGFKPAIEFQTLGLLKFIFQYIYYAFEAALVFLIIAFGQSAGERLFNVKKFPWGGALVGFTWGLVHAATKGSLIAGLLSCLAGAVYGAIYLAAGKNAPISYMLVYLAFVL
ncbi:MAG: hypothetical protein LBP79_04225 [Clostridiales bacterium]|jgi:hypothetical protein|nr:hypothetical protein [Clostridiales bacterium]